MNFDQKAVKFLANFYINGGQHWTHGPPRPKAPAPTQPKAAVHLSDPESRSAWAKMGSPGAWEVPAGLRVRVGIPQDPLSACIRRQRELPLASCRQCWSDAHPFSATWRSPVPRGMGCPMQLCARPPRTPATASVASPQPATAAAAGPGRPCGSRAKARSRRRQTLTASKSFAGRRQDSKTPEGRRRLGPPRARGAGARAQATLQPPPQSPGEKRPSPTTYDVLPGCRLQSPRPPAFSMSRSPAFTAWVSSSSSPGPAAYDVENCYKSRFPSAPGVVIQGVRRPKRHDTGPFSTL
ncbi:protein STPG3 isoform X2 [Tamandua tetradactyla]|uniref:protein STPG3 isoform X2 n=1 Tax=Tamandua tetradactyla TaxID=48850 RepID=UPI0040538A4D